MWGDLNEPLIPLCWVVVPACSYLDSAFRGSGLGSGLETVGLGVENLHKIGAKPLILIKPQALIILRMGIIEVLRFSRLG